ncbi:hypothetical protein [Nocardiopsis kunsanensis]|uniref:hypothetical protein n=1 Tax=Nocardiopsis kunsanensis TaxID=141693 RepID=UPI0003680AFF|nr:hypothetical protein [Nocardiopsis kunsanensis]
MGIDANGQVSTDNNRVPSEGQIRLSQDGNLREVTDQREATMSSTVRDLNPVEQLWADWREARRTGDTEAMNDLRAQRRELLEDMVDNAAFEMTKAGANVLGGIGLEGIRWLSSDEEDQEFLQEGQIQNGFLQVLTAAPKGATEQVYVGSDFAPETGAGQIPWRYASELGHQSMRDTFDDGWNEFNEEDEPLRKLKEVQMIDTKKIHADTPLE